MSGCAKKDLLESARKSPSDSLKDINEELTLRMENVLSDEEMPFEWIAKNAYQGVLEVADKRYSGRIVDIFLRLQQDFNLVVCEA